MNPSPANLPHHIAIIMDGNGRWAKKKGKPRISGHRQGGETIREVLSACQKLKIRYLTLYAFSVENWNRPQSEISGLMDLFHHFLRKETKNLIKKEVRLRVIGRTDELPEKVRKEVSKALEATAGFDKWNLTLAVNYGSRTEMVDAVKAYTEAVHQGKENPEECSWDKLNNYLYTSDLPDPDFIIRTSGETRLSNFLMLQSAYAEMYFSKVYWPDFDQAALLEALENYKDRERRYGLTGEQINELSTVEHSAI
jgi:undecaprenyl diphosphate synthase